MDPRDERALVDAARRGDASAFEALYRGNREFVLRVAVRYGASGADALDVLQDTFAYFLSRLPGFELRARLSTFLYPIAKHHALKRAVRRRGHEPLERVRAEAEAVTSPDPEPVQRLRVAELAAGLPDAQREVLTLRFVDGLTLAEIADAVGVPLGTVKSRLHHALSALRGHAGEPP